MTRRRRAVEAGDATLFELPAKISDEGISLTLAATYPRWPDSAAHVPSTTFSASKVNRVVRALTDGTKSGAGARTRWLQAVATRVCNARPDLIPGLVAVLGVDPGEKDHLAGLTIGEVGVCYEALLAQLDRDQRKNSGQFFTPDDAASFMASQSMRFADGVWIDPCCGVGNLAWHLARAQAEPGSFVRDKIVLIDRDETALKTAISLLSADFLNEGDVEAVGKIASRSELRDFLSRRPLPEHDYMIVNPPYARSAPVPGFETARCHDLFAFFLEKVAKSAKGYIAVTPASYLAAPKFSSLRNVLERESGGGQVFVFDNVPDTLFRGYKYGSNNTSKTNFVRAAITVCAPQDDQWHLTPILRWQAADRERMFERASELLANRQVGPHGEWAKVHPDLEAVWQSLLSETRTLRDLVVSQETDFSLDVGLTPRYFISATFRSLDRGSKTTLYFKSEEARQEAAVVLNSSLPYIWWRGLDGGVTLPRRVLLSVPIPTIGPVEPAVVARLRASEENSLVIKLNAGRENENVKHSPSLVAELNALVLPEASDLGQIYANSMFPSSE